MQKTITAKEISEIAGMAHRSVKRWAQKESWPCMKIQNSSGGGHRFEYYIAQIPRYDVRLAVQNHYVNVLRSITQGQGGLSPLLPGPSQSAALVTLPARSALPIVNHGDRVLEDRVLPEKKKTFALAWSDIVIAYMEAREKAVASCQSPGASRQSPVAGCQSPVASRQFPVASLQEGQLPVVGKRGRRKGSGYMMDAADRFVSAYNSGFLLPQAFSVVGQITFINLERRRRIYERSEHDFFVMARKDPHNKGVCKITRIEAELVLSIVLDQNRPKIGTAILYTKNILEDRGLASPSSADTFRRYIKKFKENHFDRWTLLREGEKALIDKVIPYIIRNDSLLEVGDVLVADGHRCNSMVINPKTGKPCRPILVGFFDWKSRDLVGWAISFEENTQVINAALRRAVLRLGKYPKFVLLDNGRAFKSKIFTGDIDLRETGINGIYLRMGIKTVFARPYNARSKIIERFFGIFCDWFERLMPSFCGASIDDKPATMMRNEKVMQSLYKNRMDVPDVNHMVHSIEQWLPFYRKQGHPTIPGMSRGEVFELGKGPGVDETELRFLMMDAKKTKVQANGIWFMKAWYWNQKLYGLKKEVTYRYELENIMAILVYDEDGHFICKAEREMGVHPMAQHMGTEMDVQAVKDAIKKQRHARKTTIEGARAMMKSGDMSMVQALPFEKDKQKLLEEARESGVDMIAARQLGPAPTELTPEQEAEAQRYFAEIEGQEAAEIAALKAEELRIETERASLAAEGEKTDDWRTGEEWEVYENLLEMQNSGESLNDEQQGWFLNFEKRPAYIVWKELRGKGGEVGEVAKEVRV